MQFDKLTKEQKNLTLMMDNLYLDKLKGRISDEQYDKYYESFTSQEDDIALRLSQLQEAENNYYITAKYVLELTQHAFDLFTRSEVEEKRQSITLVLQNIRLDGGKIVYEANSPFNTIIEAHSGKLWRG